MSQILDLNSFINTEVRPVTLLDGVTINLLKPTQQMLLDMSTIGNVSKNNANEVIESLNKITCDILNHNREKHFIPISVVQQYPLEVKIGVIDYFKKFIEEVLSDPNYKSPQSQPYTQVKKGKKKKKQQ